MLLFFNINWLDTFRTDYVLMSACVLVCRRKNVGA